MECRLSEPLRDEQLLAYGDGEPVPGVAQHLAHCPACRQRLTRLQQREQRLTATFFRQACPPALVLGEYKLDLLPQAERTAIAQHLTECPHCLTEVGQLQTFWADLERAPAPLLLALPLLDQVQLIIARLRSGLQELGGLTTPFAPAFSGVRGNQHAEQIFEADEGVQIIVDWQVAGNPTPSSTLFGLIVGVANPEALTATLWQATTPVATAAVDGLGNFILSVTATGPYTLTLSDDHVAYQVAPLQPEQ